MELFILSFILYKYDQIIIRDRTRIIKGLVRHVFRVGAWSASALSGIYWVCLVCGLDIYLGLVGYRHLDMFKYRGLARV